MLFRKKRIIFSALRWKLNRFTVNSLIDKLSLTQHFFFQLREVGEAMWVGLKKDETDNKWKGFKVIVEIFLRLIIFANIVSLTTISTHERVMKKRISHLTKLGHLEYLTIIMGLEKIVAKSKILEETIWAILAWKNRESVSEFSRTDISINIFNRLLSFCTFLERCSLRKEKLFHMWSFYRRGFWKYLV